MPDEINELKEHAEEGAHEPSLAPVTLTMAVQPGPGAQLHCDTHFAIPYVKWGMKDASTFLLHASDTVELEIHATAQLVPEPPSH